MKTAEPWPEWDAKIKEISRYFGGDIELTEQWMIDYGREIVKLLGVLIDENH
jgi:hypothetical protein